MVDNVSLLGAFYLWARRRSVLLLILNCLSPGLLTHIPIAYGLLFFTGATSTSWCVHDFKSAKIRPYVTVARYYGCKVWCNIYVHAQPVSNCREVLLCSFTLYCYVPFPLPRLSTCLTELTHYYTLWDFLVALYKARIRRCLLCKCVSQLVPWIPT